MSLFDVMDCLNGDSFDLFEDLFDPDTEELKHKVKRLLSEERICNLDVMLIQHLEIESEYRGQSIGKRVALCAVERLGQACEVIACLPVALQFAGKKGREAKGKQIAEKKVRSFWLDVGFVPVPRSKYVVWPNR